MANQKFTAQQVIAAIEGSAAIKATIATRLRCHRFTVDNYLAKYTTVRQAYQQEAEKIDDLAESVVIKSIQEGDTSNAKWWLERRRRDKFAQRQEITGADGGAVSLQVNGLDNLLKKAWSNADNGD